MRLISRFTTAFARMGLLALCLGAGAAQAQDWPKQPVTIIVGSGPGSAPDIIARLIGEPLSKRLGTPVIIDNKPGATGSIGAVAVSHAPADANTLLMMTAVHTILPSLSKQKTYDPVASFTPVAHVASVPLILVGNKELGAKSLAEFIAKAKASPSVLFYGTPGTGSLQHFATALLAQSAGIKIVNVPYKSGGEAITALLGNQVQVFFAGMPPALPQIQAGKINAFAVSTERRAAAAPDVPTLIELGYTGMTADNWHALVAPKDAPRDRVDRLAREIAAILKDDEIVSKLLKLGGEANFKGPAELGALIQSETGKWKSVIPATGLELHQ